MEQEGHQLYYSSSEDSPFSNIGEEFDNTDMLPMCITNHTAILTFLGVSSEARFVGIDAGTPARVKFAPHNNTYIVQFVTPGGIVNSWGYYKWSLAEQWSGSVSGGQNTQYAMLDLGTGVWQGELQLTCVAADKNLGHFTSSLGRGDIQFVSGDVF